MSVQLAVNGGDPAVQEPLGKPWPIFGALEERLLQEVLTSGRWWRGGYAADGDSKVGQFEAAFARFQDAEHAVAVTNGTAALECALKAVGIGAGDEVLVPAATFVASATAVLLVNAVPVIVDVDPRNYTIAPQAVAAAITPRTRAIVAVDYGGMPCDMEALNVLGRRHDLAIVSDCAHSHGSQWQGVGTGALGDVGAFSFQMGKTLTTGEGGMVLTNDAALTERAYSYHHIGRVRGRRFDEFLVPATNLRMTEWQGAMGLAQLTRLAAQTEVRERNATYLANCLAEVPGVAPLWRDPRVTRWGFYFWHFKFLPEHWNGVTCAQFRRALDAEGVPCGTGHTQPLYQHPLFAGRIAAESKGQPPAIPTSAKTVDFRQMDCPETERIYATEACSLQHRLLLGPRSDMDRVLAAMGKLWVNQDELRQVAV